MDTHKSKHVSGPAASCSQPGVANLAVYGIGKPADDQSSTNSSTVTSVTSTAGSDEDHHGSDIQRRSPFSSDSSDRGVPLPSSPVGAATASSNSRSKGTRKESSQDGYAGAGTRSACDNCKTAQQQKHSCTFYSESATHRASRNKTDAAHGRKETSIAVQRNSTGQPVKDERSGRLNRACGQARRAHGSGSDRLPLHRIMNDPRVYYVVAAAGVTALMVVSGVGIALAAHRRRRRRHRRGLVRGLATAKDMVTAALTTWVTYSRWFRRLVFK